MEKLTSLKIQRMIDTKSFNIELWGIILRFGIKKENHFQFPIVVNDHELIEQLYDDLKNFKGKTISEVNNLTGVVYNKYKQYNIR